MEIKLSGVCSGWITMESGDVLSDLKIKIAKRLKTAHFLLKVIFKGKVLRNKSLTLHELGFLNKSKCFVLLLSKEDVARPLLSKILKLKGSEGEHEYETEWDPLGMLSDLQGFTKEAALLKQHHTQSFVKERGGRTIFARSYKISPIDNYLVSTQRAIPLNSRITTSKRQQVVDILSGIAHLSEMTQLSLHLGVICLDKYLSIIPCNDKRLILVGMMCLFVAAKEMEDMPPKKYFAWLLSEYHSPMELDEMEGLVNNTLDFQIQTPTILTFLRLFSTIEDGEDRSDALGFMYRYLADLCLEIYEYSSMPLSKVAASVVFVSRFVVDPSHPPWTPHLVATSCYNAFELREFSQLIYQRFLTVGADNETRLHYGGTAEQSTHGDIPAAYFTGPDPG